MPDPNNYPAGWIIYLVRKDAPYLISRGHRSNGGDIYFGCMAFQPVPIGRDGASIDTAETLGIGQQHNSGEVLTGRHPSPKAQKFGKIIYNRAPHHNISGGVDKKG